jgi:hypothetical protein
VSEGQQMIQRRLDARPRVPDYDSRT